MNKQKILTLVAIMAIFIPAATFAIQPTAVNEPQLVIRNSAQQANAPDSPTGIYMSNKIDLLFKRYEENMKNCVPLHISGSIDIFGLKLNSSADINGWIDGKCEYKLSGNIPSIGKDIREVFEIKATDEQIASIQPVFECRFTKPQLELFLATMSESAATRATEKIKSSKSMKNSTNTINEQHKSPQKLTPQEEKLAMMFMTENVCTFSNKEETLKKIEQITGKETKL